MYAYFKGQFMPVAEAKLPILTHALHYGTACFEGVRCNYNAEEGRAYIFRPREHFDRLRKSARVLHINLKPTTDELCAIASEIVRRTNLREDLYMRPLAYKSAEVVANMRAHTLEDDFLMFAIPLGNYLDPNQGQHCCTSTWRRIDDMSIPPRAKVTGGYINSVLAKTEAVLNGFDEGIMLNADGHVSEGSGENVFIVTGGKLVTPAPADNILMGITRDTVIRLAREELGIETIERTMDRTELYTADELFLTGTAAHLTPVVKMDHRQVGDGQIGPVTRKLQALYFDAIRGKLKKYASWCQAVELPQASKAGATTAAKARA